jgi:hypothetical protein
MPADFLKPSEREIRELAMRETDPAHLQEFQPIAKGPVIAVLILIRVGLALIPMALFRLLTRR